MRVRALRNHLWWLATPTPTRTPDDVGTLPFATLCAGHPIYVARLVSFSHIAFRTGVCMIRIALVTMRGVQTRAKPTPCVRRKDYSSHPLEKVV